MMSRFHPANLYALQLFVKKEHAHRLGAASPFHHNTRSLSPHPVGE